MSLIPPRPGLRLFEILVVDGSTTFCGYQPEWAESPEQAVRQAYQRREIGAVGVYSGQPYYVAREKVQCQSQPSS